MKSTLNIHWKDWCWNKLEYFGHLMWRANSLEKTLMLGKIEVRRRRVDSGWDGWMASLTPWTWAWANSRRQWRTGKPGALLSVGSQRVRKKLLHQTFERISNFERTNFERILILKKLKYITNARNRSSVDNFCVCFFCYCAQLLSRAWLFVTLWADCSPSDSSVHGIFLARILEWVAISFCMGSLGPGI